MLSGKLDYLRSQFSMSSLNSSRALRPQSIRLFLPLSTALRGNVAQGVNRRIQGHQYFLIFHFLGLSTIIALGCCPCCIYDTMSPGIQATKIRLQDPSVENYESFAFSPSSTYGSNSTRLFGQRHPGGLISTSKRQSTPKEPHESARMEIVARRKDDGWACV